MDKNKEKMLLEMLEFITPGELNNLKLKDFPENKQEDILFSAILMKKCILKTTILCFLDTLIKILTYVNCILLALLLLDIFPYYIVVIVVLPLAPISTIIAELLFFNNYKNYTLLKKTLEYNSLSVNDIMSIIENDDIRL